VLFYDEMHGEAGAAQVRELYGEAVGNAHAGSARRPDDRVRVPAPRCARTGHRPPVALAAFPGRHRRGPGRARLHPGARRRWACGADRAARGTATRWRVDTLW